MKKWVAWLLAAVMLLSLTACGSEPEKENPYRLKTQTIEMYRGGELYSRMEFDYTYDEQGYLSQNAYYLNGALSDTQTFETDEYGNIVRTVKDSPDGTQTINELKLTLDAEHRVIREESYWDNILNGITEMEYDWQGNRTMLMINRVGAHDGKDWISWVDYTYDQDGNIIREDSRWNYGSSGYSTYEYQKGKLIRSENYDAPDKLVSYKEYTYDATGLIQTQQHYEADGTPGAKTISTYDEYGNLLTSETYTAWDPVTQMQDDLVDRIITNTYELITPES